MAIQIDYFMSSSEAEAARTANLESGPRAEEMQVAPSTDVDPGIGLGYLAQLITDSPLETYLTDDWPRLIAESDDEQKFVLEVNPAIVEAVARIEQPYKPLIDRWRAIPDDDWQPSLRDLDDFLEQFVPLAQESVHTQTPVYCWLWP